MRATFGSAFRAASRVCGTEAAWARANRAGFCLGAAPLVETSTIVSTRVRGSAAAIRSRTLALSMASVCAFV